MRLSNTYRSYFRISAALALLVVFTPLAAYAQGSIFGTVQNSDLSFPANGQISFFGFLDDTDEEIRIETSIGAGYDNGNWFDDFQNYLTEVPGNPYDYYFTNAFVSQGFHLAKLIPNNSFQQENVLLAPVSWPAQPAGLTGFAVSATTVEISWSAQPGVTYHVYRRLSASNGSLFRIDDPTGSLINPGVSGSFFVDATVNGISSYDYVIIGEDALGNYSQHSAILTVNSAIITAPVIFSISPASGLTIGGTTVDIIGDGFDLSGVNALVGGSPLTGVIVLSPKHIRGVTPAGVAGPANVSVVNLASALSSNTLVGGFVYTVNNPPVLAPIGAKTLVEGGVLSFTATATDIDGGFPFMAASPLPSGATFVDNGDGTGSFSWPTNFFDAGVYVVTFTATDDLEPLIVDSEQVTITITEAGNQLPVLAAIGAQSVSENIILNFPVSATDAESVPSLSAIGLPLGAAFVDNLNGTGSFSWTPTFLQSGVFNVTFIAADDSLKADSELVSITVIDAKNQAPTLAAIGPQSGVENQLLTIAVSASDAESIPSLSAAGLPLGAAFVNNLNGTGSFSWTPTFLQSGVFSVTFIAADDSLSADSEVVVITISEAGNQPPVLALIGPRSTTENINLTFVVNATDPESTPSLSAVNLPSGATFTDNLNGAGTFAWTPTFLQSGIFNVTFIATDAALAADSEVVVITVAEAGNQPPVLALIGPQATTENINLNFTISATDIESIPSLSAANLPAGASFVDNLNGSGVFNWTPTLLQAGIYSVTFIASDDSLSADSEVVTITVSEVGNQAPILSAIGAKSVNEGVALSFPLSAADVESIPVLSAIPLPAGAVLTDNGDGSGSFDWTPSFVQSGVYTITFAATDDSLAVDSEVVTITVLEQGNQLPTMNPIGSKLVVEGTNLAFIVVASDAESIPQLLISGLPPGATYIDNGFGSGAFSWTPSFLQSGSFTVTFFAQDDSLRVVNETITITVLEAGNQSPVLALIGPQTTTENINLNFTVSATDAESIPSLVAATLPAGASFIDNGDGSGVFDWTPGFLQSGLYNILFTTTDDSLAADSEVVVITVIDAKNQAPTLAAIGPQAGIENQLLTFAVSAADAESVPSLSATGLPAGAAFVDNLNGTGSFNWTPDFLQAGVFSVTFFATDDSLAIDSEVVSITIADGGNQAPVLAAIGARSGIENQLLIFTVSATDVESIPSLSATGLPAGASFVDNLNGTGSFSWTPTFLQAGVFSVTFIATDNLLAADSEVVSITITDGGNQAPVLALIGPKSATENINLTFAVSATDIESIPALSAVNLPAGAFFTDNLNGTGVFAWTPSFVQSGVFSVTFIATDAALAADSEIVLITVTEVGNQAPVLALIGAQSVTEGVSLNITVTAADAESIPTLAAIGLPLGAAFVDNLNGTGSFSWTPTFLQSGVFNVTFIAADDSLKADSELVSITVIDAKNQAPTLAAIGPQAGVENQLLTIAVSASDAESIPSLSAAGLPLGAAFVDNLNGTGSFTWTPTFLQSGVFSVTFIAADDSLVVDSEVVVITISEAGNQPPVLALIGPRSTTENINLTFVFSATDIESIPALSAAPLPAGATVVDNGNGAAVFSWTPSLIDGGIRSITFFATDDSLAVDSEVVIFTVLDVGNQPPLIDPIADITIAEGASLGFLVTATDVESIPSLTALGLPPGASFTDSLNGTGLFSWIPSFVQAGAYVVTFVATDDSLATDSETVIITVTESGNQPPVITAVSDASVSENGTLVLVITAVDPEAAGPVFLSSVSTLSNSVFVDAGNSTATLTYTPNFFDAGVDTFRVFATDAGLPPSTAQFDIIITTIEVNQAPVIDPIPPAAILVGRDLIITVTATDPTDPIAANKIVLTVVNLPLNATFVDNLNNTGTFSFTPTVAQVGVNTVRFLAIDQGTPPLSDIFDLVITVVDQNNAPVVAAIAPSTVAEGATVSVTITATDADLDPLTLSTRNAPLNSVFVDNGNGTGLFTFSPDFTQGGSSGASLLYSVTFVASDGLDEGRSSAFFQVMDAGNQAPVFTSLRDTSFVEGTVLTHIIFASDPDGTTPTLSADSLPGNASFLDNGDGTGTITFAPNFVQAGVYTVFINVTDGSLTTTAPLVITVIEAGNQPPQMAFDSLQLFHVETDLISFILRATDADSTLPIMTAINLPPGATYVGIGNGEGSFVWQTQNLQAGNYNVSFFATDALDPLLIDSAIVNIDLADSNFVPLISVVPGQTKTVNEAQTLTFVVTASDFDGTIPILSTDILHPNMTFVDDGNGTGTLTFTPDFTQGSPSPGTPYAVDFIATDAVDPAKTKRTTPQNFFVRHVNQPPVVAPIATPQTVVEGTTLSFTVQSSDADLEAPSTTFPVLRAENLPPNATAVHPASGDLTQLEFSFTPDFTQAGIFVVSFIASDTQDEDSLLVQINVSDAGNQNPIWITILQDTTLVVAGTFSEIPLSSFEPDNDPVVLSLSFSPSGSALIDLGDGTGSFRYNPDAFDVGATIPVEFYVTDPVGAADTVRTVFVVRAFLRGDANTDTRIDLTDAVFLIDFIFRSGSAPVSAEAADVNFDLNISIADITFLINYLFRQGPPPPG